MYGGSQDELLFYRITYLGSYNVSVDCRTCNWRKGELLNHLEIKNIYEKSSLNQLLLGGFIFLIIWLNIDEGLALLPEKFQGGKYVVLYIGLSKLFSVATGVNGQIIVNSKYYRFDLYSNFILLIITIFTNYIFIPESSPLSEYSIVGINGAAFATALSVRRSLE